MRTENVAVQYASFILHILTCVIGVLGNAAVIYVYGFIMKKNKSKIWFLNLAVADFVFVLCLPLNAVAIFTSNWPFGPHVCKLYHFLSTCNMYVSIFTITALTIDRLLSVAKPIWHHKFFSQRFSYWICAFIWVLTVLASLPTLFFSVEYKTAEHTECRLFDIGHINNEVNKDQTLDDYSYYLENSWIYDENQTEITSNQSLSPVDWSNNFFSGLWMPETNLTEPDINQTSRGLDGNTTGVLVLRREMFNNSGGPFFILPGIPFEIPKYFVTAILNLDVWNRMMHITESIILPLLVIGYIIPLCTILISNVIIIFRVRKSQRQKSSRLYQITVTVVVVYFLTWTPLVVGQLTLLACARSMDFDLMRKVYMILPLLYSIGYTNSCLNPIIYALVGKQVRRALREFVSSLQQSFSRSSHNNH
ncbi:C3a anaphylatoxin chemotactic receptor-like [Spea bombifrons]|uniref:C3a anaphylatoxin chemotactic receptor-like n=1 Tax=Spea bombifrons TaxID=233779 RepID=UPI002349C604|nr:C3a anaphylatoxin chemotactic receptor-like [Spea bombifrons]